jgi:hypothetical protein
MEQELFEDFHSTVVSSRIKKNWTVTYKGQEISGTYEYDQDDWSFYEKNCYIDDECMKDLTEDEIDEIVEYVKDII